MGMPAARCGARGFTLIEIMIALVIVGILVMVALPSYQGSLRKSRRVDGMDTLLELASRQERFYARTGTYTTDISGATGLDYGSTQSPDGYYSLTAAACATGTIATCYVLSAAPQGVQASDTQCGTLQLGSNSGKTATGTDGARCW